MERDELRDQFSPLLDEELSPDERAVVEAELAEDAELLRELDSIKRVDDLYRHMPPVNAPAGLEDRVREEVTGNVVRIGRTRLRKQPAMRILAVAALFLIVVGVGIYRFGMPSSTSFDMAAAPEVAEEPSLALSLIHI